MDSTRVTDDDVITEGKDRLATVDDDGVTFVSHLDGSKHRFTAEVSMRIQHQLGADVIMPASPPHLPRPVRPSLGH